MNKRAGFSVRCVRDWNEVNLSNEIRYKKTGLLLLINSQTLKNPNLPSWLAGKQIFKSSFINTQTHHQHASTSSARRINTLAHQHTNSTYFSYTAPLPQTRNW
jgi:hypothetical protein